MRADREWGGGGEGVPDFETEANRDSLSTFDSVSIETPKLSVSV